MNKTNIIIMCMLFLLIIPLASSSIPTLGTFKINTDIVALQTCTNGTGQCDLCNISSISFPNTSAAVTNVVMTNRGADFNYTLNHIYVQDIGRYIVNGYCSSGGVVNNFGYYFDITPTGEVLDTGKAVLYIFIFIITVLLFIGSLVAGFALPYSNRRDQMTGYIIALENLKYIKIFSFAFAYILFMLILWFGYTISYGFLQMDFLASIFKFFFYFVAVAALPAFILLVFLLFTNAIEDYKVGDAISRGFRIK